MHLDRQFRLNSSLALVLNWNQFTFLLDLLLKLFAETKWHN